MWWKVGLAKRKCTFDPTTTGVICRRCKFCWLNRLGFDGRFADKIPWFQEAFDAGLNAFEHEGIQSITALKDQLTDNKHTHAPAIQVCTAMVSYEHFVYSIRYDRLYYPTRSDYPTNGKSTFHLVKIINTLYFNVSKKIIKPKINWNYLKKSCKSQVFRFFLENLNEFYHFQWKKLD